MTRISQVRHNFDDEKERLRTSLSFVGTTDKSSTQLPVHAYALDKNIFI